MERLRISRLVLLDAMRRYSVGAAIVVALAWFMARAWPPHEVVAAVADASPGPRALVLCLIALAYVVATRPIADHLLASERLAYWWHLPLAPRHWRVMHLRHLAILHAGLVAVVSFGFGLRWEALVWSTLAMVTFIAAHVWAAAWRDRGAWMLLSLVVPVCLGAAVVRVESPVAAVACSAPMLALAWVRCGRPFPERRARSGFPRLLGGGPGLALLRLYLVVAARRHTLALSLVLLVQALGWWAVVVGVRHVGAQEPAAVLALGRGVAMGGATLAAALTWSVNQSLLRDRAWLDAWGAPTVLDLGARCGLALVIAAPSLAVTTVIPSLPSALDVLVCALAASVIATSIIVLLTDHRARALAVLGTGVVIATMVGPLFVVAAPLAVAGAYRSLRLAELARRRFETYRQDDDHGD